MSSLDLHYFAAVRWVHHLPEMLYSWDFSVLAGRPNMLQALVAELKGLVVCSRLVLVLAVTRRDLSVILD